VITFVQSFYFRGHLCISTELLDMNLYEFIKSNAFRGFSLKMVRRFTKQLLGSLLLLKQHRVIHCDLKPENILLAHPLHSEIKVIDFGSSCFENEKVYTYIQSRFYRSPEVILGMTYGMPIDMWSVGCILAELFTGVPIFPGENENEQLACIMEVFGPPEKHLIEKSSRRKVFFDSLGKPRLNVSSKGKRRRPSSKTLQQVLKCDDEPFIDFLTRCLRWDPDRRMKPDEAIRHEFITGQKTSMAPIRGTTSRTSSPIKRHNTISTPSASNRPLPEPPVTAFQNMSITPRGSTTSPSKSASGAASTGATHVGAANVGAARIGTTHAGAASATARRVSNANGLNTSTGNVSRRISAGPGLAASGNSGLPRVTRSVSARQLDLASAGASAAMNKRV
jgi:dual specificity tyrosine-phosphorylation-regulated kinase 2/3/4